MITMYDAITIANIPKNAQYAAGYVGGYWPTYSNGSLAKQCPKATLLSIAINASEDAMCLDVETGDATVAQIPEWVKRQKTVRPVIYSSVGNMNSILSVLAANGISRQNVRLWSAHYSNGQHICGPSSCGQIRTDMDGTQWTDKANGIDLDQSALTDHFFSSTPPPVSSTVTMTIPVTVQNGSTGQYVKRVQAILNAVFNQELTIDGSFGPSTEASVKTLQVSKGLTSDGIVGPATWKVLYGN